MRNSDLFLSSFNTIEKYMSTLINSDHYIPFYKMVEILSKTNAAVRKYQDDLKEFTELRNAIVHERTEPNFVIAEPHDTIVKKIQRIEKEMTEPEKVIPLFQREVITFTLDDLLRDVLLTIKEHHYSQFPIYQNDDFVGLLTEGGIMRWLTDQLEGEVISISGITLQKVIQYEEVVQNNYLFISRETDIYEVKELFISTLDRDKQKLEAVLITQNGRQNETPLGIITSWDIINLP